MKPTPRTDALENKWAGDPDARGYREELEIFARELERELAEKTHLFESSKRARQSLSDACDHLQREIAVAKREIAELQSEIRVLTGYNP